MVKIIGFSNIDEKLCAASGRISTRSGTSLEIFDRSRDKEKNEKLIKKVTASGHTSTVEHIFFNIAFENVSVVVERFLIEFRLASFTVKSRRYVDFSNSGFYLPNIKDEKLKSEFSSHVESLFELYSKLCEAGVPKEDARFVLPYCFFSNFYCSLNGRELRNVIRACLFGRGKDYPEIVEIGKSLLERATEIAPGVFDGFEEKAKNYCDKPIYNLKPRLDVLYPLDDSEDYSSVEIISHTENAELKIATMRLLTDEAYLFSEEAEKTAKNNLEEIINAICKCDRPRALESASYTILFKDVTLSTLTHFARHRMQTLSHRELWSLPRIKFIEPTSIKNTDLFDEYVNAFEKTEELFEKLEKSGEKKGVLVYCLLSGNLLDIVSVMNARELRVFMRLRSCTRARWEINELAIELLKKLRKISPLLFKNYGPSCFCTGICPEGRLTCGKAKEIKEKFKNLE